MGNLRESRAGVAQLDDIGLTCGTVGIVMARFRRMVTEFAGGIWQYYRYPGTPEMADGALISGSATESEDRVMIHTELISRLDRPCAWDGNIICVSLSLVVLSSCPLVHNSAFIQGCKDGTGASYLYLIHIGRYVSEGPLRDCPLDDTCT